MNVQKTQQNTEIFCGTNKILFFNSFGIDADFVLLSGCMNSPNQGERHLYPSTFTL